MWIREQKQWKEQRAFQIFYSTGEKCLEMFLENQENPPL